MKTKLKNNHENEVKANALMIEQTLESFGIHNRVVEINVLENEVEFCLEVALGTNIKKIEKIDSTIAMALASPTGSVKIEAPIPGRTLVGVRLPIGKNIVLKEKFGKDNYKIIEKPAEIKTEHIYRSWWSNITFVLGNIADLLREGLEIVARWFWKLSQK